MTPSRRLTALIAISIFSMLSSEALAEQSLYERNHEQGQVLVSIEPDQLEDDEVVEENEDVLEEDDWRVFWTFMESCHYRQLETSPSMAILHL